MIFFVVPLSFSLAPGYTRFGRRGRGRGSRSEARLKGRPVPPGLLPTLGERAEKGSRALFTWREGDGGGSPFPGAAAPFRGIAGGLAG